MNAKSIIDGERDDVINHPKHYENCSLECIEMMNIVFGPIAVTNFCMCNALKYVWRYKYKNGLQDLEKARWYIARALEMGGECLMINDTLAILLGRLDNYCVKVIGGYNEQANKD